MIKKEKYLFENLDPLSLECIIDDNQMFADKQSPKQQNAQKLLAAIVKKTNKEIDKMQDAALSGKPKKEEPESPIK